MWLLPRVRAHVPSQGAGLSEGIAARFADMCLLPRMRAHVRSQASGRREPLVARLADMWLLPRVRAHVRSQGATLSEPSPHVSQTCGFSPECVRICVTRLPA